MNVVLSALFGIATLTGSQDPLVLSRNYKVGEIDRYAVKLSIAVAAGDVDIQFKSGRKVVKVDDSGNADIQFITEEMKTLVNGQEASVGNRSFTEPLTFRFDKHGRPISEPDSAGAMSTFLLYLGFLGDRPLETGKKAEYSFEDKSNPQRKTTGTLLLESVKDGEAKLVSNWSIPSPSSPRPLRIDMTSFIEIKSGTVLRASGTIYPGAGPDEVGPQAIQFAMEILRKADSN